MLEESWILDFLKTNGQVSYPALQRHFRKTFGPESMLRLDKILGIFQSSGRIVVYEADYNVFKDPLLDEGNSSVHAHRTSATYYELAGPRLRLV